MKQPEDTKTIELALDAKRGRGRPTKEDALTPAERAKRYRDNKRLAPKLENAIDIQNSRNAWQHSAEEEFQRNLKLNAALHKAMDKISGMEKEQALLIAERATAFKAADQAKSELEKIKRTNSNTGELARQVLELEATIAELRQVNYKLVQEKHLAETREADLIKQLENCTNEIINRDALLKMVRKGNAALVAESINLREENKLRDASPKKRVRKSSNSVEASITK